MKTENGKIEGDVQVTDALQMNGMFTGNVEVLAGGHLILNGTACKSVTSKLGSILEINGTVAGDVVDEGGKIFIRGVVLGSRL